MHDIPELDDDGLKKFAFTTGAIIVFLFGLLLPWLFDISLPYWPWGIGLTLMISGLFFPQLLGPVYKVWMHFGLIMHRITTPVILAILFYLVITPIGCLLRIFNRLSIPLKLDEDSSTYRIVNSPRKKIDMEKPF